MDKYFDKINEVLDDIKKSSEVAYDDMFVTVTNGDHILKDSAELYKKLLDLKNENLINQPSSKKESTVVKDDEKPVMDFQVAGDLVSPDAEKKPETQEPFVLSPASSLEVATEPAMSPKKDDSFAPAKDLNLDSLQDSTLFRPASSLDLDLGVPTANAAPATPVEEPKDSIFDIPPYVPPVLDEDTSYQMTGDKVIQDLPVSPSEQVQASQDILEKIPSSEEGQDPLLTEIQRLNAEYDSRKAEEVNTYKPMTDEQISAAQHNIEVTAEKPKSSGKKVVKKSVYIWKDKLTKKVNILKGLLFKENAQKHSQEYMKICQMFSNFRVNYKNISHDDANKGLEAIDNTISASEGLSFEEKKRLFRKLTRLAKAVERINGKDQEISTVNFEASQNLGRA